MENLVFNCLHKDYELFYYSNEKECDFLTIKNKKINQAVQVCYELTEENKDREISGLKEAMKKFKLKEGLLLTNSQEEEIKLYLGKIIVK